MLLRARQAGAYLLIGIVGTGLIPTRIDAAGIDGAAGLAGSTGLGACVSSITSTPEAPTRIFAIKRVSVWFGPDTIIPVSNEPNGRTDAVSSSTLIPAAIRQSISCFAKILASASRAYVVTLTLSPEKPSKASLTASCASEFNDLGAIFASNNKRAERSPSSSRSDLFAVSWSNAARSFALPAASLAFAASSPALASSRLRYPSRTLAIQTEPTVPITVAVSATINNKFDDVNSLSANEEDGVQNIPPLYPLSAVVIVLIAGVIGVIAVIKNRPD